ncbi:MAG: hypothetical protein Q4D45_12965 [Lachnospiraceae bacterium]|nr:hypothetical protein [Lachnospiraceae bacterium]
MLYEVMMHIRNFFPTGEYREGKFIIKDGFINLPFLIKGQYFLIQGSVLNDGVYIYNDCLELEDEIFDGCITALAPPREFLSLVEKISTWQTKHNDVDGAYKSESFGGYSYTLNTNSNGSVVGWKDVFKDQLKAWRKI